MRRFNPIYLAAAVAIALSGTSALAQNTGNTLRVGPANTATTANTTTSTTPAPGVRADANSSSQPTPQTSQTTSGNASGTNQTTVDPATTRPGTFEPGGAFGPPGTSGQGTNNQGNNTVPGTLNGNTGAVFVPGDASVTGNPSQQTIVIQQQPAPESRVLSTPLLDQTTREAQARETRRRNAKQEPRIIGIAPNTDRDLTNQMPDDRIIRY